MRKPVFVQEAGGSAWRVPWFDGRASFRAEWERIAGQVHRVFDHDKFAHGALTAELEAAIQGYTGARHAIGVNTGADALYLILKSVGVGAGDEVIVPAFAPKSSLAPVHRARATPIFVDIAADSHTMAPDAVRTALSARTKAVLPVHLLGRLADVVALRRIATAAGVPLVEDATHAMGTRHRTVHAGRFGAAGALSFAPDRPLGALGDAGMVLTDDADLAARCKLLRHHGRTGEIAGGTSGVSSPAALTGVNSKMDEIQAAVLLARLPLLDDAIARRRAVAARYTERLAGIAGVDVPVEPDDQSWPAYPLSVDRRDALAEHLARLGIQAWVPDPVPAPDRFPAAAAAAGRAIALPVYPDLGADRIDLVCAAVAEFRARGRE